MWLCAIDGGGEIQCWSDDSNQVTTNYPTGQFTALSITEATHSYPVGCAINVESEIECWPSIPSHWGAPVPTDSGYEAIDCGLQHCCAIKENGHISCWGSTSGFSGQGQATDYPQGSGYQQVASGVYDACALDSAGQVTCWGKGGLGAHNTPSGGGHIAVAAGYYGGCALDSSGSPTCWGLASGFEPNESGFDKLYGHRHTYCALKPSGAITCWNDDTEDAEQYGYDPTPPSTSFKNLGLGLTQVCGISSSGGQLECWGELPTSFP